MSIYDTLFVNNRKKQVWILIDPDSLPLAKLLENIVSAEKAGISAVLIGGSLLMNDDFDGMVREMKSVSRLPVLLFPGSSRQISRHADGILFTSLLSGRNPQFLIGEQVMAAPSVFRSKIESIPTAYLLIESGRVTAVQYISNTMPIPRDKPKIALAHAQAAVLLGMKAVYLEAGSGAEQHVPVSLVKLVSKNIPVPVIVGGGIRRAEDAIAILNSGASAIVIGNAFEKGGNEFIRRMIAEINNSGK